MWRRLTLPHAAIQTEPRPNAGRCTARPVDFAAAGRDPFPPLILPRLRGTKGILCEEW
jgi:hypothetical protein